MIRTSTSHRLSAGWTTLARGSGALRWLLLLGVSLASFAKGQGVGEPPPEGMVHVPAGVYRPLFRLPDEAREIQVAEFFMEATPVTNGDFLDFVRQNPRWRRAQVKHLFADVGYLVHWNGDLDLGPDSVRIARQPVTGVSWFAAKAYAGWRGRRLPSTIEWEYAAGIGFTQMNGSTDPKFQNFIRRWYSTPTPPLLPTVAAGPANFVGLHDLHGLVWEWSSDYNSAIVTGDARGDTGIERQLFCGAGSQGASDPGNFPAFMRDGFRSSLKGSYTIANLGFRCALDRPRVRVVK